jgi:hypothetical protein
MLLGEINNFDKNYDLRSSRNGSQLSKDTLTNRAPPPRFGSALPEIVDKVGKVFSPQNNRSI